MHLVEIAKELRRATEGLSFAAPVACVYRPLEYAWAPHEAYLRRYGDAPKEAVLVGMNPGPFGMAQTGVPFGDVGMVRDWLGIEAPVRRPAREHEKRPIAGFSCARGEVSGRRFWGWARERFGTPERFFARFLVWNYCPLAFVEASGRNRTPDHLPAREREPLEAACDAALRAAVEALAPAVVVGIGAFAKERAERALEGVPVRVGRMPHPSPASPAANVDWSGAATRALERLGLRIPARAR